MDLVLAQQWIVRAAIEPAQFITRICHVADDEPSAVKADGSRFLEGEADCLGSGAEAFCSLGRRSVPVAAEKKLGASVVVKMGHIFSNDPTFVADLAGSGQTFCF